MPPSLASDAFLPISSYRTNLVPDPNKLHLLHDFPHIFAFLHPHLAMKNAYQSILLIHDSISFTEINTFTNQTSSFTCNFSIHFYAILQLLRSLKQCSFRSNLIQTFFQQMLSEPFRFTVNPTVCPFSSRSFSLPKID